MLDIYRDNNNDECFFKLYEVLNKTNRVLPSISMNLKNGYYVNSAAIQSSYMDLNASENVEFESFI